jgi:hypothetical protein
MSATIALTVLLVGLTTGSPALAWQDTNSETGTRTSTDSRSSYVPVGKTIAGEMVFAYAGGQDGSFYLRTYTVSPSGVISEPVTVDTSSTHNFYIHPDMIWADPAGTLHMSYKSFASNSSKISYVSSQNGQSWTTPTVLTQYNWEVCSVEGQCGIREVALVSGGAGNLALMFAYTTPAGLGEIHSTTKAPGKRWLATSKIFSSTNILLELLVVSTGKGLLAAWYENSTVPRIMSSFSTSLSSKSWTAPQLRVQGSSIHSWKLLQIGSTKFAFIYSTTTAQPAGKLWMQVFDSNTKRFGLAQEIATLSAAFPPDEIYTTKYVSGQSALVFADVTSSMPDRALVAKYVIFRNGVASLHLLNPGLATPARSYQIPQGVVMDKSGHLTILWVHTPAQDDSRMYVSQIYRGNRSDAEVTMTDQILTTYRVGFSIDGDIYMSNFWMTTISAKVRLRSDAPSLDSNVSVSGTTRFGKSVKVKLPQITASVSGQKWLNSYQWYSCTLQVTEVAAIPTDGCNLITGAVSSSYKAKSSDKGKFLQVRLSVRSDNATQVQFSASTSVVK